MKKAVFFGGSIGFLLPVFWLVVSFLTFNGPESHAADAYWRVVYATCPTWRLPASSPFGGIAMSPVWNAVLYATIALLAWGVWRAVQTFTRL